MCSAIDQIEESTESLQQRQDDEFLSIAAIYPNEVKDLRLKHAWKTWKPLEIIVTLTPENDCTKTSTQVDLYVRCSDRYPYAIPFIDVRNSKGLSSKDIPDLKHELRELAKRNIGHEMLLEFIQFTRSFLEKHDKPQYQSFYDEMVHHHKKNQQEIEEKLQKEKEVQKLEEQRKIRAIEEARNRKLEALRHANKRTRLGENLVSEDVAKNCNVQNGSDTKVKRSRSCSTSSCIEYHCSEVLRTTLKLNGKKEMSVFCGQCLSHNERGAVLYHGMDTVSGEPVAITKWTFHWSLSPKPKNIELETTKKEQEMYLKHLTSIEQEFKTLRQLKHENLVQYLGMTTNQKKDKINIFLFQEYVSGCSLAQLANDMPFNSQQLQYYARGILLALQYLHQNSIVHKNLRGTSILISNNGKVKITDFSLDKRLYDLYRSYTNESEIDYYPPTIGKGGKKGDVYRFGVLLLSLSTGHLNKDVPKIPDSLSPSLRDFLSKCLMHDEHKRWSIDQLLSHSFMAISPLNRSVVKDCADVQESDKDLDELCELPLINEVNAIGSRLRNEFEVLKCLGKGGFGYVLKVRNKLDARIYALKRIPLNPTNKQLDRKIKREVKLLSRLNHENIVRYYNSWIEETVEDAVTGVGKPQEDSMIVQEREKSAANSSIQWDMLDNKQDCLSSDEEDIEDYDTSLMFRIPCESLSYIVFEGNRNAEDQEQSSDSNDNVKEKEAPVHAKIQRFMYIQMEFCEKSTLRTAIDNNVYKDVSLVWRLFREIVEGLHHIHQQGVIHRDLKPVNIFLDSKDHVKIGDFGLATDVISKVVAEMSFDVSFSADQLIQSISDIADDNFRTGHVGTALYIAPEIASDSSKLSYSQKVDIYSLGIIFFEMCYPPPLTAMERSKLIMNLRQPDIVFPTEINDHLAPDMLHILKWLLQHDFSKRPTAAQLIASDIIPMLLMEETELHNALKNTISNPQSRTYKYMINGLFDQDVDSEFDFTYDMDISKGQAVKNKPTQVFSDVICTLNKVLQKHGAVNYSVPTLMPKSSLYDNLDTCVCVLDHGGGVINLPHDLRVPFARHVAHKEITQLKRFTLEKVYREQKVFGCHPREQYEYAFDIITPTTCSFMPDAEIMSAISEIISELPSLQNRNYFICLNHVSILKAIFLYSGVTEAMEAQMYLILDRHSRNSSRVQLQHILTDLKIPETTVMKLTHFFEMIDSPEKAISLLQPLIHSRGETGTLTKKGLKELKAIISLVGAFGVKQPIFICPCLAHDIRQYSGLMFQFVWNLKMAKKKPIMEILAAGGRYDKLVSSFKFKSSSEVTKGINQSAVGVSIAVERIVAAELENNEEVQMAGIVDFLIYSLDPDMAEEKSKLLKELWTLGFSATAFYEKHSSFDEAVHYCRNNNVSHLLILLKNEPGVIKVRSFEKEKINEKKMCNSELKEYLSKFGGSLKYSTEYPVQNKAEYQKSYSLTNLGAGSVRFLPQDKSHSNRKREPNIRSHVMSSLNPLSSCLWEIIALDLKMSVIGSIASVVDVNCNAEAITQSFTRIYELHSKYKKYLTQLLEEICDLKIKKQNAVIILYSMIENNFRVLL